MCSRRRRNVSRKTKNEKKKKKSEKSESMNKNRRPKRNRRRCAVPLAATPCINATLHSTHTSTSLCVHCIRHTNLLFYQYGQIQYLFPLSRGYINKRLGSHKFMNNAVNAHRTYCAWVRARPQSSSSYSVIVLPDTQFCINFSPFARKNQFAFRYVRTKMRILCTFSYLQCIQRFSFSWRNFFSNSFFFSFLFILSCAGIFFSIACAYERSIPIRFFRSPSTTDFFPLRVS